MSDELLNQDLDVEGHSNPPKYGATDEPGDEVEAHSTFPPKYGANDEPSDDFEAHSAFPPKYGANDEPEDEVEGHVHRGK